MKPSRGMGAIMPSKMPGKKIIHRKDKPQDVEMYAKGGRVKKYDDGGEVSYDRFNSPLAGVGEKIANDAFSKAESQYRKERGMPKSSVQSTRAGQKAYEEALDEARREASRGAKPMKIGGKVGLYENIHKKRARMAAGSGEQMRKPGSKGAPSKADFIKSAKTAKKGGK